MGVVFSTVKDGTFPLNNISYQLFLDTVQWHSLSDKRLMRYSNEVKRFWALGYKLFKGRCCIKSGRY